MKNNFQSNGKGRYQRVWQLLISMLFILTMGIGQMWADDTYYLQDPAETNGTPALTGDFYTTCPLSFSVSKTYETVTYKKGLTFNGNMTSMGSNCKNPNYQVRYDCKTNNTSITVIVYNKHSSNDKKLYRYTIQENSEIGEANTVSDYLNETITKNSVEAKTYEVKNSTRTSIYFAIEDKSNQSIVQIIAVEKGTKFPEPGEDGYQINFNKMRYVAPSGSVGKLDATSTIEGVEMYMNDDGYYNKTAGKIQTNNTHYIKFSVAEKMMLSFVTSSNKSYTVGAKGSTSGAITPTANKAQLIKLPAAGTYYINPQGSNVTPIGMSFYIPVITYNKNNVDAEGTMSTNTWTVVDNGFTAPEGKVFKEWNNKADGTGDAIAVGAEMLTDTTLYAIWQTPAAPPSAEPTISAHPSTAAAQYFTGATATALSVTASGSGTVTYQWYSNTTASNADGTIIDGATSASYTPSTAAVGTLYYYCAVTNTETSKSPTTINSNVSGAITVIAAPTHLVENRLNVTSGDWSSNIYTNDPTNITSLTAWQIAAGQDRTAGVTDKQSIKNNRTHGIGTTATKTDGYYMYLSFTIADGKRLKLSAVNIPVFGISANKTTEVEIADANSTKITVNGTITADTDGNGFGTYDFSEAPYLQGAVTLKMWAYGATSGYRMKSPIYLDGAITAIPVCTPPDPPTGLQVDSKTYNSANLSWDEVGINTNGYQIALTSATGAGTFVWKDTTTRVYEATGLTPNTAYTFKVKGYAAGKLCSSDEVKVNFTTNAAPAQYTVHYMDEDGTTPLGSDELVVVGEHPVGLSPAPTKPLFTFASWQKDAADIALDAAFWATVVKDAEVTLTARWTKAYAQSIDMEQFVMDNTKAGNWHAYLDSKGYAYASSNMSLDSLDGGKTKNNYQYLGLKFNKNSENTYVEGNLQAQKLMIVKVGAVGNNTYMKIDGAKVAEPAIVGGVEADSAAAYTYWYYDTDKTFSLFHENGGTSMLKGITITDPYQVSYDPHGADAIAAQYGTPSVTLPTPANGTGTFKGWYTAATEGTKIGNAGASYTPTADITLHAQWETVSSDNTLSDLQVDGATIAGFDPDVHIYYLGAYEYGQHPEITSATPTAEAAGATVAISNTPVHYVDATNDFWYVQANVTPASGTPIGYNQVRYTVKPKQGVSLIKVVIPNGTGNNQDVAAANITGYIGGTAVQKLESGKHKLGSKGHYIGITLASGTFQEDDIVNVNIEEVTGDKLRVFSENTAAESKVVAQSAANMVAGVNAVLLDATSTNSLYLRRGTDAEDYQKGWNPFVGYFEVQRLMPSFIESFELAGVAGTIDQDLKTISVEVPYSTDITSLTPTIKAWANGGATMDKTGAQDFSSAVVYKVTSAYAEDGEVAYTVNVTKAVASSDATLSALSVAGYELTPAFDPAELNYSVELPYGTTVGDLPEVSYTKGYSGSTVLKTDATALPGATTIKVTAEDATVKTYTINFTVSKWESVTIWDGSTMTAKVASGTGAHDLTWATTGFGSVNNAYEGYKGKTQSQTKVWNTSGASTNNYMLITVPKDYVAKFYIAFASNSNSGSRGMTVSTQLAKNPTTNVYYGTSTSTTEMIIGTSEIVGAGQYYINPDASINFYEITVLLRPGHGRTSMLGDGVIGTVCVPNNVAVEDIQGVTVYELMGRENQYGKLAFDEIVSGELEAGVPYVFQAHGDKMIMFYGDDHEGAPVNKGNGMYGTFVDQTLTELDDVYYFAQRALWSCDDLTSLNLPANRAYVKLSEINYLTDPTPAPGRRRITMEVNGEKVATDINNVQSDDVQCTKVMIDGQMYILRGEKMYDATGRLVK